MYVPKETNDILPCLLYGGLLGGFVCVMFFFFFFPLHMLLLYLMFGLVNYSEWHAPN